MSTPRLIAGLCTQKTTTTEEKCLQSWRKYIESGVNEFVKYSQYRAACCDVEEVAEVNVDRLTRQMKSTIEESIGNIDVDVNVGLDGLGSEMADGLEGSFDEVTDLFDSTRRIDEAIVETVDQRISDVGEGIERAIERGDSIVEEAIGLVEQNMGLSLEGASRMVNESSERLSDAVDRQGGAISEGIGRAIAQSDAANSEQNQRLSDGLGGIGNIIKNGLQESLAWNVDRVNGIVQGIRGWKEATDEKLDGSFIRIGSTVQGWFEAMAEYIQATFSAISTFFQMILDDWNKFTQDPMAYWRANYFNQIGDFYTEYWKVTRALASEITRSMLEEE